MSESTSDTVDWQQVAGDTETPAPAPAAAVSTAAAPASASTNLPPTPPGVALLVGRLPIECDTAVAVVQLPEAIKGVSCAAVFVNSGVLSDCHHDASDVCVPTALRGQPINDREIKVFLKPAGRGDGRIVGAGWSAGGYPGALPTTRPVEVGIPYVEVLLAVGIDCGCSSENWAADPNWGQP